MKSISSLVLTLLCLTGSIYAQTASDAIDPDNINYGLIQALYLKEINSLRSAIGAQPIQSDPILLKAAQDQAAYCTKTNLVTHNQPENDRKYDPQSRVKYYHGNHGMVGENALMTYIHTPIIDPKTQKTFEINTYGQMAHGLFMQWKNSPKHYANMINGSYAREGLAISVYKDKKVVYAVEVFGSTPYTPPHNSLTYSDTTWGVKEHVESKCKPYGEYDFLASVFSSYLIEYNDSIYQYYQDEKIIRNMLTGPKDGIAVDMVYKNQFSCPLDNNLHPSTVFDGYMLRPKYRDELFRNDVYKSGELLTYLGSIPKNTSRAGTQLNTILIQNGMQCRYSYPVRVENDILKDLPIYPQWCKAEGTLKKGVADFDREFDIPFEKNITKQDSFYFKKLKDLVSTFDGAITSVEISAYSSVEGSEANNLKLQKARADFIEGVIKKNMKQPVAITKNAQENWARMYDQIRESGLTHTFGDTLKDSLRANINRRMAEGTVSYWLNQQRIAKVKIHLHKEYDDKTEARFMPLVIYDKMYKSDSTQAVIAYSRVINAYQQGNLDKRYLAAIDIPLKRMFLPMVNNYLASIIVQSDIFNYSAYSASYLSYIDSAEKKFADFKPLRFNMAVYRTHLYFHGQRDNVTDFRKLGKIVDTLCKDSSVDRKLRYQLEFNYYLSGSVFYYHQRLFTDMFACFEHVKGLLPLASLKAQEVYDIGRYFNYFSRYKETIKLLDNYLEKYPDDEDLIYLYVNTGAIVNLNLKEKVGFYYEQVAKLAAKNKPRLCKWFNENYQLLREAEFKKKICTDCKLEQPLKESN